MDFGQGEHRFLREEAQHRQKSVGLPVDMSRITDPAHGPDQLCSLLDGDRGGRRQEPGIVADGHVLLAHNDLLSEDRGLVLHLHAPLLHQLIERQSCIELGEQTDHVDVLRRGQLHARHGHDAVFPTGGVKGRTVLRRVVIRQRHDPEPVEISHPRDVAGGHIVLRAGRQAGVDVQIDGKSVHESREATLAHSSNTDSGER